MVHNLEHVASEKKVLLVQLVWLSCYVLRFKMVHFHFLVALW